jgi:hypothetical protein
VTYSLDFASGNAKYCWQNDDTTGRIGLQLVGIELVAQADLENAG